MRLVSPSEQKEAARERRAASAPGLKARWLQTVEEVAKRPNRAKQREIAREAAIESEQAKYILLECGHYTTKQDREFWNDGEHPELWYCEECNFNGIPHWDSWRNPYPSPVYPSSDPEAIPPF